MNSPRPLMVALVLQIVCIPVVIAIFKVLEVIPGSFVATSLFVLVGGWTLWGAYQLFDWKSLALVGALQFLVIFAGPIALMRVLHPTEALEGLFIGPVSIAQLHAFSNLSFMFMMLLTGVDLIRYYRQA